MSSQTMMDTKIMRGPKEYLSIVGGVNPNIELSSPLTYIPMHLKISTVIQLRVMFHEPQNTPSGMKVLDTLMV
jgi:hypothetical protein